MEYKLKAKSTLCNSIEQPSFAGEICQHDCLYLIPLFWNFEEVDS